jgi:hypothetical protein
MTGVLEYGEEDGELVMLVLFPLNDGRVSAFVGVSSDISSSSGFSSAGVGNILIGGVANSDNKVVL